MMPAMAKVVVVGGGLAGLASSVFAAERGHPVTLVERRPTLGGRTHALPAPQHGDVVDNGQHVLLAGYRALRAFLRTVGTEHHVHFEPSIASLFRDPVHGEVWLRAPRLPGPLARLGPLVAMLGLANVPLVDKVRALRALPALARLERGVPAALDEQSAASWLDGLGVPASMRRAFWDPFIVSTLNEKPERVSAHLIATLLRWGFLSAPDDGRLGYPTVDLDTLFVKPALAHLAARGAEIVCGAGVRALLLDGQRITGLELADGRRLSGDAFILAVPPAALVKLLAGTPLAEDPFFERARYIGTAPIVAVNLWLDRPLGTRHAFEALLDCPIEWVFDRTKMHDRRGREAFYYTLIVSAAWSLIDQPQAAILEAARASLALHYRGFGAARIVGESVVKHPHATFSAAPGFARLRPTQRTPVEGLYLAGDWTDTDLPSTMEAAAESARRAVAALPRVARVGAASAA
jgi:squalene-associated FAD-dependent desaturase